MGSHDSIPEEKVAAETQHELVGLVRWLVERRGRDLGRLGGRGGRMRGLWARLEDDRVAERRSVHLVCVAARGVYGGGRWPASPAGVCGVDGVAR